MTDGAGVPYGPVLDDPAVAYADHVHGQDLVAPAGGGVGAAAGVAVDRQVAGGERGLDGHGGVLAPVLAGGHPLPLAPPRGQAMVIAFGTAAVVDHIGIDQREPVVEAAG